MSRLSPKQLLAWMILGSLVLSVGSLMSSPSSSAGVLAQKPARALARSAVETQVSTGRRTAPAEATRRSRPRTPAVLPVAGKGMWIYEMHRTHRGDPVRIVRMAERLGLTHIYVRVGSGWTRRPRTLHEAARVLPAAHAHGIKVVAWYFPYFRNVGNEVAQSLRTIRYRYRGHRFDGFAADIERVPGAKFRTPRIARYSRGLQRGAGEMPLISVVPWPSTYQHSFPYGAAVRGYDAVAPMAYWGFFSPLDVVATSMKRLKRFGIPIAPIGQAYNMGPEGGPRGRPHPRALHAFMAQARAHGAVGVSFWSWQHAGMALLRAVGAFPWPAALRG